MNNPSYLGKNIQYFHCINIFNMRTRRDLKTPYLEGITVAARVSTNPLDYRGVGYIVRPLTGNQETNDPCHLW